MRLIVILTFSLLFSCSKKEYPKSLDIYFRGENPGVVEVKDKELIQEIIDILENGQKKPPFFKIAIKIWVDDPNTKTRDFGISGNRYKTDKGEYEMSIDLEDYLREKIISDSNNDLN